MEHMAETLENEIDWGCSGVYREYGLKFLMCWVGFVILLQRGSCLQARIC